jgi:hypothetical protein
LAKTLIIPINNWFGQASKELRLNAVNGYVIGIPLTSREQHCVLDPLALDRGGITPVSNQAAELGAESGPEDRPGGLCRFGQDDAAGLLPQRPLRAGFAGSAGMLTV